MGREIAMRKTKQTDTDLERYHADALWFGAHYKELKAQYPDHWVCIYNEEVAGAHEDAESLISEMQSKNVPVGHAFFDFVHAEEKSWVFTPIFK